DVEADPFFPAAVDGSDKGAGDHRGVGAQGQRLEDVGAGADAAVHQDFGAAAVEGRDDLGQDFSGGGALVQDTPAVVGHDDRRRAGLLGFEGALDGHDALDDKGLVQDAHDLPQLFHALAAGRRVAVFQDRKSTRVNSSHVSISYAVFCLKKKILKKKEGELV